MGKIWTWLMLAACCVALAAGSGDTAGALMNSGGEAVELTLTLMGSMVLWSGLMEILRATGDVARLGRGLRKWLAPLFGGMKDEESWETMGMNMAANMLGLGNAATPAGIRAAQLLSNQGEMGARALGMLLVLNNSGLQLMPTTVMALRSAAGAANPADIWLPALLSSLVATVCGCGLMWLLNRRKRHG